MVIADLTDSLIRFAARAKNVNVLEEEMKSG
jgi:hypothetical protein